MCAVEAGGSAGRATCFPNESDSLVTVALCRPAAKLLGAGYQVNKTSIPRPRTTCLKRKPGDKPHRDATHDYAICRHLPAAATQHLRQVSSRIGRLGRNGPDCAQVDTSPLKTVARPAAAVGVHFAESAGDS